LHDNAEKKHSPAGRTAQDSWPIYAVAASLLIALGALAWWADNRLVDQAQKEIGRELNAVLSTTTRALDHWFQNFEEVLRIWGSDDVTLELSQALLDLDCARHPCSCRSVTICVRSWHSLEFVVTASIRPTEPF
jgi:hypothetical protein